MLYIIEGENHGYSNNLYEKITADHGVNVQ